METFKPGDRVVRQIRYREQELRVGTVMSIDTYDPTYYLIEWDKGKWDRTTQIEKVDGIYLSLEVDARAQKSKLEMEFETMKFSLEEKIDQVVTLLNEASNTAREKHQTVRAIDSALGEQLLSAIENAGWNMSSQSC